MDIHWKRLWLAVARLALNLFVLVIVLWAVFDHLSRFEALTERVESLEAIHAPAEGE